MPAYLQQGGKTIRDADWVAKMFMVSLDQIDKRYQIFAHSSTANSKFTDTAMGGNWAVNMPPAYTRFADPRQSALTPKQSGSTKPRGMGQFYSEQLDDNAHLIHMSFGVANFRGMVSFFTGMGNIEAALYARLGRVPITFLIGEVAGVYTALRFLPLLLIGTVGKFLLNRGSSKYYSFKPTMHAYWQRVDFIANTIAVSIGLYQKPDTIDWGKRSQEEALDPPSNNKAEYEQITALAHRVAPDIFKARGGIDTYQWVTRSQRLATARRKVLEDMSKNGVFGSKEDVLNRMIEYEYKLKLTAKSDSLENLQKIHNTDYANTTFKEDSFDQTSKQAFDVANVDDNGGNGSITVDTADKANAASANTNPDGTVKANTPASGSEAVTDSPSMFDYYGRDPTGTNVVQKNGWLKNMWSSLAANYDGAYQWVSFKVNHTGSISSSFSSATREAEITSMINGFSSTMAGHRFTFSNGATGIGVVDSLMKGVKNTLLGYVSGLDVAGVISLAGSAYVDIPEHWESSSASFPSESFKIPLRSVYANKLSRFMSLYVPLAMFMAGALPISTGRQQYTSPYLCQVISPGRMSCKLGIIEQLSIDIGTGNVGFNNRNQPLAFDVSFTVKDMNKTMHAPIDTGASLLNPLRSIFDDDNAFNDYLNVISAVSMADQTIGIRKLSRNIAIRLNQWDSFWSMGNWTMGAFDSPVGQAAKTAVTLLGVAQVPGIQVPQLNRSLAP